MNPEKQRRIVTALRKRQRSDHEMDTENKRPKDLLDGDLDDFISYVEHFNFTHDDLIDKPPTTNNYENEYNEPIQGLSVLKSIEAQNDMKLIFGPLLLDLNDKFTRQIDELKGDFKKQIDNKDERIVNLETKVELLEYESKKKNLRFHGIPNSDKEDPKETIIKVKKENLNIQIDKKEIDDCFRIGDIKSSTRPILVKFVRGSTKHMIYKAKKCLKDTGKRIYVNEDLTKNKADLFKQVRILREDKYIWKSWTFNSNIYYTLNKDDDKPKLITKTADIEDIRKTTSPRKQSVVA
jgi:hypothetical protein